MSVSSTISGTNGHFLGRFVLLSLNRNLFRWLSLSLEGTASYAGLLLAPAKGLWPRLFLPFKIWNPMTTTKIGKRLFLAKWRINPFVGLFLVPDWYLHLLTILKSNIESSSRTMLCLLFDDAIWTKSPSSPLPSPPPLPYAGGATKAGDIIHTTRKSGMGIRNAPAPSSSSSSPIL